MAREIMVTIMEIMEITKGKFYNERERTKS